MTAAYKQASKNYQDNYKHVETIRQVFLNSLTVPYEINSVGPSLPHVINISFSGKENGPLLTPVSYTHLSKTGDKYSFCELTGMANSVISV